jgi:hypothetical protein
MLGHILGEKHKKVIQHGVIGLISLSPGNANSPIGVNMVLDLVFFPQLKDIADAFGDSGLIPISQSGFNLGP